MWGESAEHASPPTPSAVERARSAGKFLRPSGLKETACSHDGCSLNSRQMRYFSESRDQKPLSAWKLKQLKLTPAGIKKRRKDANARERKRMNGLNEAFERLRDAVPAAPGEEEAGDKNKKLSKMDTLQMANLYIRHLVTLLNSDQPSIQ